MLRDQESVQKIMRRCYSTECDRGKVVELIRPGCSGREKVEESRLMVNNNKGWMEAGEWEPLL